eukprot:scaffold98715_cov32-Tisochrysis_lutea.AAC.3
MARGTIQQPTELMALKTLHSIHADCRIARPSYDARISCLVALGSSACVGTPYSSSMPPPGAATRGLRAALPPPSPSPASRLGGPAASRCTGDKKIKSSEPDETAEHT